MGWFWDSKESVPPKSLDPYSNLDPALREFLDKESPLKYSDTQPRPSLTPPPSSDDAPNKYRSQLGIESNPNPPHQPTAPSSVVPSESLYSDGRYAHLWKNYRPQNEVEAAGKSDQDRLSDVIGAYNDRKAAVGRAAVENCIMEQMAERDCWQNGDWSDRMTLCRGPNRQFMRCYTMQTRFLKALGYLSGERPEAEEEKVQMHADKLYHEMLKREEAAEMAKKEGLEAPQQAPLIEPTSTAQALGENSAWARARQDALAKDDANLLSAYSAEKQEEIRQRIAGMSEQERDLELQLTAAESRQQVEYAKQIAERLEEEKGHRAQRRERGRETVGDSIKRAWGWDK